jgi:hypothetical protein
MKRKINTRKQRKRVDDRSNRVRSQRRRVPAARRSNLDRYAAMLAEPCTAELVSGLNSTDEGLLARLKTTFSLGSTALNGFALWDPTYIGGPSAGNCFMTPMTSSAANSTNSVADPYIGNNEEVGATAFVTSNTVSDFRLVSACLRVTYIGTLLDSKGIVAKVSALPVETFFDGLPGVDAVASVDAVIAMSAGVERMGTITHEVRFHPQASTTTHFKRSVTGAYDLGVAGVSRTSPTNDANRFGASFIGFAWKGVPCDQLSFEFIQNIEWRPDVGAGFVSVLPKQIKPQGYIHTVTQYLDQNWPGWSTAAKSYAGNQLVNAARRYVQPSLLLM